MDVRVHELPPDGLRFAFELDEAALRQRWHDDAAFVDWQLGPAKADVLVRREHGGVRLLGTVDMHWVGPCERCLTPVEGAASEAVDLRFEPQADAEAGEVELREGGLDILEFDGESVPLSDWLAEQASLALATRVLCRPDCRGLCLRCGADLNAGDCGCEPAVDARWTGLTGLRGGR